MSSFFSATSCRTAYCRLLRRRSVSCPPVILRGGRQDRSVGSAFIIPRGAKRLPLPSFCVESGRWHTRTGESDREFSSSKNWSGSSRIKGAMLSGSQQAVWSNVLAFQEDAAFLLKRSTKDERSPSSYELTREHGAFQERRKAFLNEFSELPRGKSDVIGMGAAIGGRIEFVEIFGSAEFFGKLWEKILAGAIDEAIGRRSDEGTRAVKPITPDALLRWIKRGRAAKNSNWEELPPRTRIHFLSAPKIRHVQTYDVSVEGVSLHESQMSVENGKGARDEWEMGGFMER